MPEIRKQLLNNSFLLQAKKFHHVCGHKYMIVAGGTNQVNFSFVQQHFNNIFGGYKPNLQRALYRDKT